MVEKHGASSQMVALQKEVNKLFEQLAHFERAETGAEMGEWIPSVDVFETKGDLIVKVEAPGMTKGDFSLAFVGLKLEISGEKKPPRKEKGVNGFLCLERSFGKFRRDIYIDQAVDLTRAEARLASGVLTITMPKLKDRRGSEIQLEIHEDEPGGEKGA